MKKILALSCFLIISSSFAQTINQFDDAGKRHGVWRKTFDGTEVLRYEGAFHHGNETGLFKFYKNIKGIAVLTATRQFTDTSDIAEVKFFTSKGKIVSEGNMRRKIYVGTWKYYQKDSDQLLTLEHYNEEGQLEGQRCVYFENGQIAEKTFYKSGNLHREAIYYTLKGVVLKTFIYDNGELHGVSKYYNPKGELIVEGYYKNGKKHGVWNYYENGKLVNTKNFTLEGKYKPMKKAP
ncbi:toxin-antitoxin system YwqK family antitoxin [Algibacter sp. 2305UL17-15]|uniref:toxin-antitoxin system YwqK family antitoxin n=1 Tax=Algibacter sp. 2305UL17-15 TaxID=3231268 RepID=UPI00345944A2